jgi:phosphoglycerate kinase
MAIKYIKYIDKINLKGKRVLIRVDFNVPLDKNKNITDDTRIRSALPTINYAIKQDAKIILMSHLGRPKGTPDSEFSLLPVAKYLSQVLQKKVILAPDCIGPEKKHDREFGRHLANLADVYINDAFGTAHRAHASNVAVVEFVKEFGGGFLMKNEIEYFRKAMVEPARPLVAIMGGAKVSEKLDALENLIQKVDKIFIGGGMAFTFLTALGYEVGKSLVEGELVETAKRIMAKAKERKVALLLPVDCVVADQLDSKASTKITSIQEIPPGWMGLDIGPATQVLFAESLAEAKTIVWNGPMGVFEMEPFSKGTFAMVRALAESSALTIVGGGDTDVAVHKLNAADKISYISTGGGAFIEILKGKPLPAISVLERTG